MCGLIADLMGLRSTQLTGKKMDKVEAGKRIASDKYRGQIVLGNVEHFQELMDWASSAKRVLKVTSKMSRDVNGPR